MYTDTNTSAKKIKGSTVALLVLAGITLFALIGWLVLRPSPLVLQGEVEATSYKVASKVPGRVDSLVVRRGDAVQRGDLLYRISSPEVTAKLTQASAAQSAAEALQAKAVKGARKQQIEQAYELWKKAEAGLDLAKKTYARVKNLYDEGVVPAQKLDEAEANLQAMKTSASAAKAGYSLAVEGARLEDRAAAAALVAQAEGAVQEVQSYATDVYQYAPVSGEVSNVVSERGELVGAGFPVVTIVDLADTWVVFHIKETMLPKIKMGTKLFCYFPALDEGYELTVSYIAAEASYATWAATRTSGAFDVRTFEIHARPTSPISYLRPGMTATLDYSAL